jgi:predicted dehydrogenase
LTAQVLNLGIIGHGYWGPNLLRNFMQLAESNVLMVSDLDAAKLERALSFYPGIESSTDPEDIFSNPDIEAVAIATPVSTHYELADRALEAGKHVLVTKPFTSSSEQAEHLIQKAKKQKLVLAVDHTFVYTGAVRKIKDLIDKGELGEIYYYDSTRINLGLFQHDVNVLWDLAVHDLTIMDYILENKAIGVAATGMQHVPGEPENVAYLTVFFENKLIAHINTNWLAPVKVRQTLVGGSEKMIVYNDLEPSEKIRVYDRGVDVQNNPENIYQMLISYRSGDMWAPHLDLTEALHTEATHFVECIREGKEPITNGESGLRVVRMLEAADKSLAKNGAYIALD